MKHIGTNRRYAINYLCISLHRIINNIILYIRMTNIKQRLQLFFIVLALQPFLFARTTIPIQKDPDLPLEGPSVPSRAPSREDSPIEVYLDNSSLYIEVSEQIEYFSYSIFQEDSSFLLLSNYYSDVDNDLLIDLNGLGTGHYLLSLQVNGTQYSGIFIIE